MVEVGAPDECIAEMRSYLHLEGWLEPENLCLEGGVVENEDLLPKGWLLRTDENSVEGGVENLKCSIMRESGEVFENWQEGLMCLESLGKDTSKLKEMLTKKMSERTNCSSGEENGAQVGTLDDFLDIKVEQIIPINVETGLQDSVNADEIQKRKDLEETKKPDFDVGKLPSGWTTKNKPGDKGFRIYSPSGSIYIPPNSKFQINFEKSGNFFYSWHTAMADLRQRGDGTKEEVRLSSAKFSLFIFVKLLKSGQGKLIELFLSRYLPLNISSKWKGGPPMPCCPRAGKSA